MRRYVGGNDTRGRPLQTIRAMSAASVDKLLGPRPGLAVEVMQAGRPAANGTSLAEVEALQAFFSAAEVGRFGWCTWGL